MGRACLSICILLAWVTIGAAQTQYPEGAYMSLAELVARAPSESYPLDVVARTKGDIVMNGGNDYKLVSSDKAVKKKVLKKEIFAFSDGEDLYINCFLQKCQLWYARVEEETDDYLAFSGGISSSKGVAVAVVGGAVGAAAAATVRYPYRLLLGRV